MSQENVEIVRRMFDAFTGGDAAAALAAFDPEIEWDTTRIVPDGDVYHGHEGVARFFRRWLGTWEESAQELKELIDAGHQVIAAIRESGRGKGSGVEVEVERFDVYSLRDGKIVRYRWYRDRAEALEAAGLQE